MEHFYQHTPCNSSTIHFSSYLSDTSSGQPDPFDSAPTTQIGPGTVPNASINDESGAINELLCRLSGNSKNELNEKLIDSISYPTRFPNLGPIDPGFAERAARFSKFGSRSFNGVGGGGSGVGTRCQIPRISSCQALRFPSEFSIGDFEVGISRCDMSENGEESSSVTVKITPQNDLNNSRKRKLIPRGKKEISLEDAKRTKYESKSDFEAPKDYIHVRARRGQATDSHSLAERVRREKISQRMKFLQDLVPGCNKVTGKAVMLDEIINYVQSLQRQVEFLSMRLSTLNPSTDINMEELLTKDLQQACSLLSQRMFALESSASATFPYGYQSQCPSSNNNLSDISDITLCTSSLNTKRLNHGSQFSTVDEFAQPASQVSMWIDELHNVVQMGYGQDEQKTGSLTAFDVKSEP